MIWLVGVDWRGVGKQGFALDRMIPGTGVTLRLSVSARLRQEADWRQAEAVNC